MKNRSQIGIFIIIGLVALILVLLVSKNLSNDSSESIWLPDRSSLDLGPFVEDCLEETTLEAIGLYGLNDSIKNHIDSSMIICLSNFSDFPDVKSFSNPNAHVDITNSSISVELKLLIGTPHRNYEDFEISIPLSSTLSLSEGNKKIITSSDRNFQLIYDQSNNNEEDIDRLEIRIEDSRKYGNLVVSPIVYQGEPDGTEFGPPLTAILRLRKSQKKNIDPAGIKVSWFDDTAKIWRPYPNQTFKEDETYYYYGAKIDHFTPIALVTCSSGSGYGFEFDMGTIYRHPIEPALEQYWMEKDGSAYLIPELNQISSCNLETDNHYSIESKAKKDELCDIRSENSMARDWDGDDSPDKIYEIHLDMIKDGTKIRLTKDNALLGTIGYEDSCLQKCREIAVKGMLNYLYGENHDIGLDIPTLPEKVRYDNRYELIDYTSGDGINDDLPSLTCELDYDTEYQGKYTAKNPRCIVESNNLAKQVEIKVKPLEEEDKNKVRLTLEYLKERNLEYEELPKKTMGIGFFATPKSFGYDNLVAQQNQLGDLDGIGRFHFTLPESICIDAQEEFEDIRIYGDKPAAEIDKNIFSLSILDSNNPTICSLGDDCRLTLNEPNLFNEEVTEGKLRSGENILSVYVTNKKPDLNVGEGVNAFYRGKLFIKGNILATDYGPEDIIDVNCYGQVMRIDYPNNVRYDLLCPTASTCIYVEDDADKLVFDTIASNGKRVGCRPICSSYGFGQETSCRWAGLTENRDTIGECKFDQDFCLFERGYPNWGYKKRLTCIDGNKATLNNPEGYARLEYEEQISTTDGSLICT